MEILRSLGEAQAPPGLEERVVARRAFGPLGVEAPPDLWHRVVLAREGEVEAPPDLWERVAPAVREAAPRARVVLLRSRLLRRALVPVALAASVLLAVGAGLFFLVFGGGGRPAGPELAAQREELRAIYRSKVLVVEVPPEELSPTARSLAGALGAPPGGGSGQ